MQQPTTTQKTFPLKNLPLDIHNIIIEEQTRLEVQEGFKLKRQEVYYRIIREWKEKTKQ